MKKTISIVLALLFCVSIVSCGKKKVVYTFYLGEGADNGERLSVEGFVDMSDLDFTGESSDLEKLDKSKVSYTKSLSIDGVTWKIDYQGTKESNLQNCSKKKLQKFGQVDKYMSHTAQTYSTVHFYHETGELKSLFLVVDGDKDLPKTKLTDDQLVEKAKDAIALYYGENALDQYELDEVSYIEDENWYSIAFDRYLYGYKLGASFQVILNAEGKIRKLSGGGYHKYAEVANDVTKEMIQNAETALREKIPEDLTVQEDVTKIVIESSTGKLYLRMYGGKKPTYNEYGDMIPDNSGFFYVNIE